MMNMSNYLGAAQTKLYEAQDNFCSALSGITKLGKGGAKMTPTLCCFL